VDNAAGFHSTSGEDRSAGRAGMDGVSDQTQALRDASSVTTHPSSDDSNKNATP